MKFINLERKGNFKTNLHFYRILIKPNVGMQHYNEDNLGTRRQEFIFKYSSAINIYKKNCLRVLLYRFMVINVSIIF